MDEALKAHKSLHQAYQLASHLSSSIIPTKIHFDAKQCHFLALKDLLLVLAELLQEFAQLTPPYQARFSLAFQELHHAIADAHKLLKARTAHQWLRKAVKRLGNGSDFAHVKFRIHWSFRVVRLLLGQIRGASDTELDLLTKRILQPRQDEEVVEIAIEDTESLKIKLSQLNQKWMKSFFKKSSSDIYLVNYLSKELEVLKPRVSDWQHDQNIRLPDYLWVDRKNLRLGQYLGGGAFGSVHECTWLKKKCAIKVFRRPRNEQFEIEAAIQLNQRHPNIVQVICCSSDSTNCSLVMERMDSSLTDFIRLLEAKPPFPLHVAVDIMLQIAEGMMFLHSRKVFHCDLKASNVLVKCRKAKRMGSFEQLCVKLADFGMAKTKFQGSKITTSVYKLGTLSWKAPETLVDERKHLTTKADVYSYAITCYEILTGNSPYDSTIRMKVQKRMIRKGHRPALPSDCPSYLTAFIQRCWDGVPENRPEFGSICAMLRHLKCLLLRSEGTDWWSSLAVADLDELRRHVGLKWIVNEIEQSNLRVDFVANWLQNTTCLEEIKSQEGFCELVNKVGDYLANLKGFFYDLEKATTLFSEAASRGSQEAQKKLELCRDLQLRVDLIRSVQNGSLLPA